MNVSRMYLEPFLVRMTNLILFSLASALNFSKFTQKKEYKYSS